MGDDMARRIDAMERELAELRRQLAELRAGNAANANGARSS